MGIGIKELLIVLVVALIVSIFGRILIKAGYSRWWSLTLVVPLVNFIMIWIFAYAKWPSLGKRN